MHLQINIKQPQQPEQNSSKNQQDRLARRLWHMRTLILQ